MSITPDTPPLVDLASLFRGRPSAPWRLRLTFVGENPENVSGESAKYWQITGRADDGPVEIRWGRLGSRGQNQMARFGDAAGRASAKVRKGYVVDRDDVARASVARVASASGRSLSAALAAATWRRVREHDALFDAAAVLGWVLVDLGLDVPPDVRCYVGRDGELWAARVSGDLGYCKLPTT
jgi:predicted DNA-binding WGR domain protein